MSSSTVPELALSPEEHAPSAEVLGDLARGDASALADVYERYGSRVHRLALALTLSADEADDVVQEVFIGLPEAIARYTEMGAFEAWLLRIAARVALRRARYDRRNAGEEALAFAVAPTRSVVDRLTLEGALSTLSSEARQIVVLKILAGYSHEEIARHLGLRRNTVEVRLFRALAKLRSLLSTSEKDLP